MKNMGFCYGSAYKSFSFYTSSLTVTVGAVLSKMLNEMCKKGRYPRGEV